MSYTSQIRFIHKIANITLKYIYIYKFVSTQDKKKNTNLLPNNT